MSIPNVAMFHGVTKSDSKVPPSRGDGAHLYDVNSNRFSEFLKIVKNEGENCKTVITFDDGEENNYSNAFPLLKEYDLSAHFFVIGDYIGRKGFLSEGQIQEMDRAGMKIGSHGMSHRPLIGMSSKDLIKELVDSKMKIEKIVGHEIDSFSVPLGFYDHRVMEAIKSAGYQEIFVSDKIDQHGIEQGRFAVMHDWTIERFHMAVRGKTPLIENAYHSMRIIVKRVLGVNGYNKFRSFCLRLTG